VPLGSDPDPVRRLGKAIAARGACLVILDNVEQVLRPASETLSRWLDAAPAARFLVTTRELLGVRANRRSRSRRCRCPKP
jgi:predicted ATPase